MARLRIRIELSKGKPGVPLDTLGDISKESERFFRMVGEDVGLDIAKGQWLAVDFESRSLSFTAEYVGEPTEEQVNKYNDALEYATTFEPELAELDGPVRRATMAQFAKIAIPAEPDEVVGLGIYEVGKPKPAWHYLSKEKSEAISKWVESVVEYYGSVQGAVHSLYKEAHPPYFDIRELSTNKLIKCSFSVERYPEIWKLLEKKEAIVHISGMISASKADKKIEQLRVQEVRVAQDISEEDFERFFGIAPDLTGELTTEDYLDKIRGDAE
ncbi:hypothetical protein MYX64_03925 [Nitrospinae bacterium AH_259_B05_G02_I21]|nr:hypothetical protein [Nitrospinae bacterium AH_259_B05_G02_I21]